MRTLLRPLLAATAVAAVLLPGASIAAEEDDAPLDARFVSAAQPAPGTAATAWAEASVVDDRELAQQRGGADLHLNENNASAIVRDNVATNLNTGNNSINGDSFSGMSGVPMVVQNSGNNVVIQNSTILNLQLQ
jgi:hypothetical protein